ncbi:class I SAM-dependent methyltransferase [Streptomyces sp. NPDC088846]|uniref:class I SAM-dependent methyltransferase n=1 Tax=Streptomyces sp. NPDC088846 TaxID=3365908 RepID=UPI0038164A7C
MSDALPPRAADVRALYERFPYPSPNASSEPIFDTAVGMDFVTEDLEGREVLDAGCGSGHRLVGLACQYPETSFVGLDFSSSSLAVARELAATHACENIEFIQAEIGGDPLGRHFDVITSTGVIHHLEDPARGTDWLQQHARPDGLLYTWYYHPYGEFDRLLGRELVQLLMRNSREDLTDTVLGELELSLSVQQYGTRTSHPGASDEARIAADVDAYLHPIVRAYTFQEAAELFRSGSDWAVAYGANWDGGSGAIDVGDWSGKEFGVLAAADLFESERLREVFSRMDARSQLDCVELVLRPTGITLVTGRSAALERCSDRIKKNAARANLLA